MLEITELAIGLNEITQGRASRSYCLGQNSPDGLHQALRAIALNGTGEAPRRQASPEQALRDINIAETGDNPLIEQGSLDWRRLPLERCREDRSAKTIAERLRPEIGEQGVAVKLRARHQIHKSKPPRVVEADRRAIIGLEHDMIMHLEIDERRRASDH